MSKLLLIDDDQEFSSMLKEYLERDGYTISTAYDGESGVAEALANDPGNTSDSAPDRTDTPRHDLIILDHMLPGINGVEVLRRIRIQSNVPVLMLTAQGEDVDKILSLEMGADDYVPKPCMPREITARVRAILRRSQLADEHPISAAASASQPVSVGSLTIWPEKRQATWTENGHTTVISLTSTEFTILALLATHAGHVVKRSTLAISALNKLEAAYERSVDVHIYSLRNKLGQRGDGQSWIQTIRGEGYLLSVETGKS